MNSQESNKADGRIKQGVALAAPILVTTVGVGWLLTVQNVIPGVQWAWVLLLAVLGGLIVLASGVDKMSFVVGPALMAGSALSLLRQTGRITIDMEVPLLTVVVGALWTLAHLLPLPTPSWIIQRPSESIALHSNDLNRGT
jgi:hypothetical protein